MGPYSSGTNLNRNRRTLARTPQVPVMEGGESTFYLPQ